MNEMRSSLGTAIFPYPLNPPLPALARAGFPHPAKVVGQEGGKILVSSLHDIAQIHTNTSYCEAH